MLKSLAVLSALALAAAPSCGWARPTATGACSSPSQRLDEAGFVRIGGIEQWVTIKGDSCAKPVILVLHGGPGDPLSPFADAIYGAWEKDFTIVQWDQRGAGKTYGRNPPAEGSGLSIEQMTSDGVAVADYLRGRLGKRKVILMGGSWSSILGIHMIKSRPELFWAYVGSSSIVRYKDNEQAAYDRLLALARAADDRETVARLEAIGPPPWADPHNFGILRRADRKYEALKTDPAPKGWWTPAAAYATPQALADAEAGGDYSYLQFVGLKGDGMFSHVDLYALGPRFKVPVFFVQGAEDLLTTPEVARRYFDSLQASPKAFVLAPRTGHDPNQAMLDAQFRVLKEDVVPLVAKGR